MKIPKTIKICGKTYTVTKDPKFEHGRGKTFKQEIIVGTCGQTDERVFDTFLHEVAELVCCENNYRYGDRQSETLMFVMSHKEYERFISDVANAIYPLLI